LSTFEEKRDNDDDGKTNDALNDNTPGGMSARPEGAGLQIPDRVTRLTARKWKECYKNSSVGSLHFLVTVA
jgi:hypothetical protein